MSTTDPTPKPNPTQFKEGQRPWNYRETPGCGKPGHDTDYFDSYGRKSCHECRREQQRRYHRNLWQRRRKAALEAYGNQCACCGETIEVFLCIDHVNDDGNIHRKTIPSGAAGIYRWLEQNDYPEGFQVLCFNCNFAKSQGGCPHQSE